MSYGRTWIVAAAMVALIGPRPFSASPPQKIGCVDKTKPWCFQTIQGAIDSPGVVDGDTINISAHVYEESIVLKKNLYLVGSTSNALPPITTTIRGSGQGSSLVFVPVGKEVTLLNIRITNGNSNWQGGGIRNNGTLLLRNVVVDHNWTTGEGAGIYSSGTLHMIDCTVHQNSTYGQGGGIASTGTLDMEDSQVERNTSGRTLDSGGGIWAEGTVRLDNTDVIHNVGFGAGGGIYLARAFFNMTDGNISDNLAFSDGGGVYVLDDSQMVPVTFDRVAINDNQAAAGDGGGVMIDGGDVAMTNVTLSGNSANNGYGGAVCFWGRPAWPLSVTIHSSTLTRNHAAAGQGGAIGQCHSIPQSGEAVITLGSSLLSHNIGGNCAITAPATLQSWDYNISDDATCDIDMHADLQNTDPKLNPLAMNPPGRVWTHALQTGSPAENHTEPGCMSPVDARGVQRAVPCDTGAYEGTEPPKYAQLPDSIAIVQQSATCRFGPGTAYAAMGYVSPGESHSITGRNQEATWLKLETCWVAAGLLHTDSELQILSVLAAPPLPTPTRSCWPTMGGGECSAAGGTWKPNFGIPGGKCDCP